MIRKLALVAAIVLGGATTAPARVTQTPPWTGYAETDRMDGREFRTLWTGSRDVLFTGMSQSRPRLRVVCALPTPTTPAHLWVTIDFDSYIPRATSAPWHLRQAKVRIKFDDAPSTTEMVPLYEHHKQIGISRDTPAFGKLLTSNKLLIEVSDREDSPIVEFRLDGLSARMAEHFGDHCPVPTVTSSKETK